MHYENFDDELKRDLPLKWIWILVEEGQEAIVIRNLIKNLDLSCFPRPGRST